MAKDLFLAVSILSILSASLSLDDCNENNLYIPQAKPGDDTAYYICLNANGTPSSIQCPEDMVFNATTKGCSYKYDSPSEYCPTQGQVIPVQDGTCTKYKVCKNTGTAPSVQLRLELVTCDESTPIFDPFLGRCVKESDYFRCDYASPDCDNPEYAYTSLAAPGECESLYECKDGVRLKHRCGSGKVFDISTFICIDQSESACRSGPLIQNICKGKEEKHVADPNYCMGYYYCYDGSTPYWNYCPGNRYFINGACTYTRPSNCKCEGLKLPAKGKVYVRYPSDKTRYVVCQKGKAPVEKKCPKDYVFDADEEACVASS